MKVVIIGGVAGGASAAARLRRLDENAQIILLERSEYISYANCGLPYYIGGEITDPDMLTLQSPQSFWSRFRIDTRIFNEAVGIDPQNRRVTVRNLQTGETYEEAYDKLILSPGAKPIVPPIEGIDQKGVFTLRTIPDTERIQQYAVSENIRSAVIVGGGYIGVEMAENLRRLGLEVTIAELSDHVIAPLDFDMACDVHNYLLKQGIRLRLSSGVTAIQSCKGRLTVSLQDGELCTDMVILSVGVRPESELAKEAGIACSERGSILTDETMRTSDENIYAVGDAVEIKNLVTGKPGFIPLAGPANRQGRIAADNICGIRHTYKDTQGSAVLKIFEMTVATTGINETEAKKAGLDYDKVYTYSPSHATYYPGATNMSVKTIFERKTGRILGAQLVGFDGVDKRCDVLATAIRAGMTADDLADLELCYAPPYSSAKDPVNMIGFVIQNVLGGLVKQFFWDDIAKLPRDGSVTLLDTRTKMEYQSSHIDGFINIPLDELRERLDELDPSKPVYECCHSGLRSYVASRILSGSGFDCYNLSGGYRLYASIAEAQENLTGETYPCGLKRPF
ncbi:FAD-dependent oxidoreductase [Candidatus Soleaferrea massiliensis]|uniref:FAD-dependent oxidoreductase n=1 Tax=Candidatus Soleaferrea massiliensis TaxID=1470354 RepID=UPI0005911862|nr:FAD-dependent oxidoreductase [Candidatus Soleaferrea massiliensis]